MPRSKTTRKSKTKSGPVLTIPELRTAMHGIVQIGESLANMVKSGTKTLQTAANDFSSAWHSTFGRHLDSKKSMDYLKHLITIKSSKKGKKQTRRKMRGGMAPLGYQMGPGTGLPHGNFPDYVSRGFVNPEPAILKDCGIQAGVLPYPNTGSNKVGGSRSSRNSRKNRTNKNKHGGGLFSGVGNSLSAIAMRPFIAAAPPSVQQDAITAMRGQPLGPGPQAWQSAYTYQGAPSGNQVQLGTSAITRTMTTDVQIPA